MENIESFERISEFSKKFSAISEYLGYKKFVNEKPKILFLDNKSWISKEIKNAINNLEITHSIIDIGNLDPDNKKLTLEDYLKFHKILIEMLINLKPDFILTINHAAFDSIGLLTKILDQFKIPFVSWFVDSPLYIFKNPKVQISKNLFLFSWEETYLDRLREEGFENLYYLPLATSYNSELSENISDESFLKCDVAFVGNTNKYGVSKFELDEFKIEPLKSLSEKIIEIQLKDHEKPVHIIIDEVDSEKIISELEIEKKLSFESFCVLKCTEIFRNDVVEKLIKIPGFKIFGDDEWKKIYPNNYVKSLDYYKELPLLYRNAKIVINVTSFQMNTAINQRVFDSFMNNGFMISDNRRDYGHLFGEGIIPTFENEDELFNKIDYYLKNEDIRIGKREEIKEIIKEKHTYEKRILEMIDILKKNILQ